MYNHCLRIELNAARKAFKWSQTANQLVEFIQQQSQNFKSNMKPAADGKGSEDDDDASAAKEETAAKPKAKAKPKKKAAKK